MRKLQKIFGLVKKNERGFVILELIIGLPLILILLLSMNNLLINTWQKCKYAVADFILQQEMESAMQRIVEDAQKARFFLKINSNCYKFSHYDVDDVGDFIFFYLDDKLSEEINEKNLSDIEKAKMLANPYKKIEPQYKDSEINLKKAIYIKDSGKIYRETNSTAAKNPITGDSVLSQTIVNKFKCELINDKAKILKITLEAMNVYTGHQMILKTEVFMKGLHDEE